MVKYITFILLIISLPQVWGQQTFKVTKSLEEVFTFNPGDELKINGERTFIFIESKKTDKISATIEVIARHSNENQAKEDVEKIKISFKKKGGTLYYSNSIVLDDPRSKPKSNLKTILKLTVPEYTEITSTNAYGELNLTGQIKNITSQSKYSQLSINNFTGQLDISSNYGTVSCTNSDTELEFDATRTNLLLNNITGKVKGKIKYGEVDITYNDNISSLDINAEHSPVTLIVPEILSSTIETNCSKCDINVDNCQNIIEEKITNRKHTVILSSKEGGQRNGKISSEQETIKIITTSLLSKIN